MISSNEAVREKSRKDTVLLLFAIKLIERKELQSGKIHSLKRGASHSK